MVDLGDLARYLDACGLLLDRIRATLEQRLADAFPDTPADGRACQDWLIPYFARLLDVHLVSPYVAGRREEVANAIAWRQRKGTLTGAERLAEAITQQEVELQEGWRRVAVTPRAGFALLPEAAYGVECRLDPRHPLEMARHPGLPAATVDLRCPSGAVQTQTVTPATRRSRFGGVEYTWRQANPAGVPRTPGAFDDVSRRTVDLRTPDAARGHIHPRRVLVHAPLPWGLFARPEVALDWETARDSPYIAWSYDKATYQLRVRNHSPGPVCLSGELQLRDAEANAEWLTLEGLRLTQALSSDTLRLVLRNCIVPQLTLTRDHYDESQPLLNASDCLFGSLSAPDGFVRLDSCTVTGSAVCGAVEAVDCLFATTLTAKQQGDGPPAWGRIAHSRVPAKIMELVGQITAGLQVEASCTAAQPHFFVAPTAPFTAEAAILTPENSADILFGATDGGELGVGHRGRPYGPVHLSQEQTLELSEDRAYVLRDLVFEQSLQLGSGACKPLRLERVAVSALTEEGAKDGVLLLEARSTLFGSLTLEHGGARLEYCTVLAGTRAGQLLASDCLFAGAVEDAGDETDCVRYSRVPAGLLADLTANRLPHCTGVWPVFFAADFAVGVARQPGCGVLHPATPEAVGFGAEDGGELGAYHDAYFCLQREALQQKLITHLPVGIEPVLIPDGQLNVPPAALDTATTQ